MTNTTNNDDQVLATFSFNGKIMFSALQSFLNVLAEEGVEASGDDLKFTVLGYLVEALAVAVATSTEVSEGDDILYILANHVFKRTKERLHEKWLCDLKEEAADHNKQAIDLSEIDPQGRA